MDISKLSHGAKLVLGATILFLVVSIFNWQEIDFEGIGSAGISMWHGWGVLAGLLAIAIVVWEGLRLANLKVEIGLTPAMVTVALAILLLLFTVLKFLVSNEFRTFWAWLGLLFAILVAVGSWLNMKALGESIGDMKSSVVSAASGAAAAARSATDKSGDSTTGAGADTGTAAPTPPPAAPPAESAPPPPPPPTDGPDEPNPAV